MNASTTFAENVVAGDQAMQRFLDQPLPHLIGGEAAMSVSGETFDNTSPIDGEHLGAVA
ncbi:MAG: hypothetical protein ACI81L_002321, partial [Verrucomicrobiales bacterium]